MRNQVQVKLQTERMHAKEGRQASGFSIYDGGTRCRGNIIASSSMFHESTFLDILHCRLKNNQKILCSPFTDGRSATFQYMCQTWPAWPWNPKHINKMSARRRLHSSWKKMIRLQLHLKVLLLMQARTPRSESNFVASDFDQLASNYSIKFCTLVSEMSRSFP